MESSFNHNYTDTRDNKNDRSMPQATQQRQNCETWWGGGGRSLLLRGGTKYQKSKYKNKKNIKVIKKDDLILDNES